MPNNLKPNSNSTPSKSKRGLQLKLKSIKKVE